MLLQKHPNILVLKAFTKLYGMASLRLGYLLCADVALLRRLRDAGQPWAVSGPAQAAGLAALKDKEYRAQTLALIAEQRELLKAGIQGLGIPVVGSHANYLFFRQPVPNFPEKLAQKGILIRSCDNFTGMPPGYCRVAVRKQEENQILLDTIKSVLEG